MLVILQIPVFDFRSATSFAPGKLSNPSWPQPVVQRKPFIRHFGNVQMRVNGGVEEWVGEDYYCKATRALQYVELQRQKFTDNHGSRLPLRVVYKRFFSDGKFLNKIELALRNPDNKQIANTRPGVDLQVLFKHYLQLPVRVGTRQLPLLKAGKDLADLFFAATTRHSAGKKDPSSLVRDGEHCLLAVMREGTDYAIPNQARLIDTYDTGTPGEQISLYGYILYLDGAYFKTWIIVIPPAGFKAGTPANAILRKLRINLMRIHAEKETVKGLLNAVQQKQIDIDAPGVDIPALAEYLKDTAERLFTDKQSGIDRRNILDFALRSEQTVMPDATLATLTAKLNNKFLAKTMQKFVDRSVPVEKKLVLFLCSSPADKPVLNFGEELAVIQRLHDSSIDRANFQIEIRTGVERNEVTEQLVKLKPDILHISLHANNIKGLYFEDANRNADPMDIKEWTNIIQLQQHIHTPSVIILSACNSIDHAKAVRSMVSFVAGTVMVLPDAAGVEYARGFYTVLFNEENSDYPTCHLAGLTAIANHKPPFEPINGTAVDTIIQKA